MFGAPGRIALVNPVGGNPDERIVTQGAGTTDTNYVGFTDAEWEAWWAFGDGAFGSVDTGTWNGETLKTISAWLTAGFGGADEFYVCFDAAALGATWFTSIILKGTGEITLDTADASYDGANGGDSDWSSWVWGVSETVNLPSAWDGSGDVTVEFVL